MDLEEGCDAGRDVRAEGINRMIGREAMRGYAVLYDVGNCKFVCQAKNRVTYLSACSLGENC